MLQSPSNRKLNKYLNSDSFYNKKGVMVPMSFKTVPLTTSRPANVTPHISPPAYRGTHGEKHFCRSLAFNTNRSTRDVPDDEFCYPSDTG